MLGAPRIWAWRGIRRFNLIVAKENLAAQRTPDAARAEQFTAVANLSLKALSGASVQEIMETAVDKVALLLDVEFTKVLERLPDGDVLLLRAGKGWKPQYVAGETTVCAGLDSQAGYTLRQNDPVIVADLRTETRFSGPAILHDHNVVSGVSVVIPGSKRPHGVLGLHSAGPRTFAEHEIQFVQAVANVLATAIERSEADRARADAFAMVQASEERFRAVVQNAVDMVTIVNAEGAIVYDSPPVQRTLGYDPEERRGHNTLEYVHPDDTGVILESLADVTARPGAQVSAQARVRHRDGHWLTVVAAATNMLNNEAINGIVVNWHDVTERVQIQRQVEDLNAELEKRVRQRTAQLEATNSELESFAYSVSHDLRAPLRAMDGYARILLAEADDELSEMAQRYLKRIRHNAQQMDQLIQDLLAFSRLNRQELRKTELQPERLIADALDALEAEQEDRSVAIVVGDLPTVHADPTLLRAVCVNLLSNALKYTRTREPARIEVGVLQQDDQREGEPPVFFVRDNGVGFDMKYADKLFGVFQRLHRAEEYEGTGVGLATVQRIVRRHGGRVWAEGEVDKGAAVYFTLEE